MKCRVRESALDSRLNGVHINSDMQGVKKDATYANYL